jgi:hypothetical protein
MSTVVISNGTANHFIAIPGLSTQYISNVWTPGGTLGWIEWGVDDDCSSVAGGQFGPLIHCSAGLTQPYSGRSFHSGAWGTTVQNPQGGVISPGEWNTSASLDVAPMTAANVQDTTEPNWARYAACNLGGSNQCSPAHWDGFAGYIYIGNFNRLAPVPYVLSADFKTANAASQFTITISVADSGSGQCGGAAGTLLTQTVTTSTTWTPWTGAVDFTGKAGCVLVATFGSGSTTDQLRVGQFEFTPKLKTLFLQVATFTPGASCPANTVNGAFLGSDANNLYMCEGGVVTAASFSTLTGSLTSGDLPVATGLHALANSNFQDVANQGSYNGANGFVVNSPGPGSVVLTYNAGTPPALPANSAGWRSPASGGTSYIFQPPATMTQGFLFGATPAAGSDGRPTSLVTPQHIEFPLGATGNWPFFTAPYPVVQYTTLNAGHFENLTVTNSVGGSCTTAPTFNIYENGTAGSAPVTGHATQDPVPGGTPATAAQTLAYPANAYISIVMTSQGSGCTGAVFSVYATMEEP